MSAACNGFVLETGITELEDWWPLIAELAEGVVLANVQWLRHEAPEALRSLDRVRFEPSVPLYTDRGLAWPVRLGPAVVRHGRGNCYDLACLQAALLRRRAAHAARVGVWVPADGVTGHAVVKMGDRVVFDPSKDVLRV